MTVKDPNRAPDAPPTGATIYTDEDTAAAATPPTGATVYDRPASTGGPNLVFMLIALVIIVLLAVAAWNFLM